MAIDDSYFKSTYDRVFDDMDQYGVRGRERKREGVDRDYGTPTEQLNRESQALFPEVQGLSADQQDELRGYQSRLGNLSPMRRVDNAGSYRIQGNPYSIDSRGAMRGISDLATGLINKERKDRIEGNKDKADRASRGAQVIGKLGDWLGADGLKKVRENSRDRRAKRYAGFDERYDSLASQQQRAAGQSANRQAYRQERLPEIVKDMSEEEFKRWKQDQEQKGKKELAEIDNEARMNRLKKENDLKKNYLKYKNDFDSTGASPSAVSGMARVATNLGDQKMKAAETLREIKKKELYNPDDYPDIDKKIDRFEKEANKYYRLGGSVYTNSGGINKGALNQLDVLIKQSEYGLDDNNGDGLSGNPAYNRSELPEVGSPKDLKGIKDGAYIINSVTGNVEQLRGGKLYEVNEDE